MFKSSFLLTMSSSSSNRLDRPLISVDRPDTSADDAMSAISAAKPDIAFVVAFYNITWENSRFSQQKKHERTLTSSTLTCCCCRSAARSAKASHQNYGCQWFVASVAQVSM